MRIISYLLVFLLGLVSGKFIFERWGLLDYQVVEVKELRFADSGVYQGTVEDGMANGKGDLTWGSGDQYEGQFKDGLMHGHGTIVLADGSIYTGDFKEGLEHGQGHIVYSNGGEYQGEFVKGNMEGKGTYTAGNGMVYKGDFKKSLFEGNGVLTSADGTQYTGEFKNGDFNGKGNLIYPYGDTYFGEFKDGNFEGFGTYKLQSGESYIGNFVAGNFEGNGEFFGWNGEHYKGQFEGWEYHGEGVLTKESGEHYEGEFLYGFYHGTGKLTQADGTTYEGEFRSGLPNGEGTMVQSDGETYKGEWLNGELQNAEEAISLIEKSDNSETILNKNGIVLQNAIEKLKAGTAGKIDYFNLFIAGDGTQQVFEKEVKTISNYFDKERSLLLVNQKEYDGQYPLATTLTMEAALSAINQKMDPEDVLFLYMTSHGSKEGAFSIKKMPFRLNNIYHKTLADSLSQLSIENKVIFISSCYSGTYIPELKDETTTVITAASATTTSFGCSNNSDITWFAKAFFSDLPEGEINIEEQFVKAVEKVKDWEKEEEYEFSNPQIWIGEKAPKHLPIVIN